MELRYHRHVLFVRRRHPEADVSVLQGLAVLSLLLGVNHLVALVMHPWILGHVAGLAVNAIGLALYAARRAKAIS